MKRILIIQTDGPAFLYSTLKVLEKYFSDLPETEITLLANTASFTALKDHFSDLSVNVVFNALEIQKSNFDIAANLSLIESSWKLLGDIRAKKKLGIYFQQDQVRVSDHWSTYLLTLKSSVPFLSFSLEEIYKNILGATQAPVMDDEDFILKKIIVSLTDTALFPAGEQEAFLNLLAKRFSGVPILDVSEADHTNSDGVLYIGPSSPQVMTANYARNLLLQNRFQGANLVPGSKTWILTSPEKTIMAQEVLEALEFIFDDSHKVPEHLNLYRSDYEGEGDSFIQSLSGNEAHYPIYLSYFVLWNFVLGLKEFEPPLPELASPQKEFLKNYLEILKKVSRFHTYALASLDILLAEGKSETPDTEIVSGHLENLREIDETLRKISDSHSMLRPLLDFYHIRRGQNDGGNFREQVENSLLTYHEEHQAFQAFQELLETLERR